MERRRLHMNSPMADSTRIEASPIGHRPMPSSFLGALSPLRRNSVIGSNDSRTPEKSLTNRAASASVTLNGSSSSISRQKLNLSQLDPRTFADVHSSGLTSRIAAYHESSLGGRSLGGGLQRSMSANNLYNPLSQTRRPAAPPLPYKSSVPVLSLTQIAPPERSFYSGNTLSSLMRSNSLIGVVHKPSDQEQLSRENRPILHPPHPQHECEPTRSVLEELKEISRKRINSGDTQSVHDFTKRSCQREDFVDMHQHHPHHQLHQHHQQLELHRLQQQQLHHHLHHHQHQSFKRQRELTVAVPLRHNLTSLPAPPPTLQHMYSNGAISPHQSPEQVAKRRNCSYTNDIASSLSSSRRHNNKRKLFVMRESLQRSRNESAASSSSPENSPESKVQRKVDNATIGRAQSMPVPPAVSAVPPARTISAPSTESNSSAAAALAPPAPAPAPGPEKPKLTLFNARQPAATVAQPREDLNSPDVEAGEYAGIQFVKPKQQNAVLGVKNASVERTQKTKLAIMLSGLKGELYQGEDEPDATPAALSTPIVVSVVTNTTTTTTTTTSTSISTEPKTMLAPSKPVILSNQVIVPAGTARATPTVPKLAFGQTTKAAPAGESDVPASAPALSSVSATAAALGSAPAPAPAPATPDKAPPAALGTQPQFKLPVNPIAPGSTSAQPLFNFGSPKSSTATNLSFGSTNTTTSSSTSAPLFSFGQAPATNGPTVGTANNFKTETTKTAPTSTNTTNSLGQPNTTTFAMSTAATKTVATVLPIFGQPIAATASSNIATTTTTATVAPFGSEPTATSSMLSPPKATPLFAFGQSSATASSTSNTVSGAAPAAVFAFGGSTTPATNGASTPNKPPTFGGAFNAKPEPTKPAEIFGSKNNTFGSAFKTAAAAVEPTSSFAIKTPTTTGIAAAPASATNLFTFGGAAAAKPAEPAAAAVGNTSHLFGQNAPTLFSFGGAAAAKETSNNTGGNKSVFAFGEAAGGDKSLNAVKPSAVFSFGGGDKPNPPPTFGSLSTPTAAAATSAPTATSNAFSFGSAQKLSTPTFGSGGSSGATAPAAAKTFSFGGAQQAPAPTTASTPTGGFSFAGAAAKKSEETSGPNIFGSPSTKPSFSFGGNTSNQASGAAAPAASVSFSFSKKEEPAASNVFGSPASANTGVVKPTFAFGGSSNPTPQAAPAPSTSFGGFGAAQPAGAGASNPNKPFAFGASLPAAAAPSTAPNMGGNLFASAVEPSQNQAKPGGFSFGGAKSATNNSTAGNAPFAFVGAAAGGNQSMNTPKLFNFAASPSPNLFSPGPTPAASNPAGAFGFSGGASPAQQANASNMFAPPPENRPYRKATRRLQK